MSDTNKVECLFIGGPWDGRRIAVDPACEVLQAPEITESSDDAGLCVDTNGAKPSGATPYRRAKLFAPGREWHVFVAPDVGEGEVISRLIAGYATAVRTQHKKFILFQMQEYDNAGGLNEMQDSFETLPEAQRAAAQNRYDISEVVDRDTWEIIWKAWRAHESLNSIASPEKQA